MSEEPFVPEIIRLSLAGDCRFKCDYCFLGDNEKGDLELSLDQLKQILDEAEQLGFSRFSYIGREPLNDLGLFIELTNHGKGLDLKFDPFYTNGLTISSYEQAMKLFEMFKNEGYEECPLALSVDQVKIEQMDSITGNAWAHILNIIKAFTEVYHEGQLEIGRVTIKDNIIIELLNRLGSQITDIHSFHVDNPMNRISVCYSPELINHISEFFGGFSSLTEGYILFLKEGGQLVVHNRGFCESGLGETFLNQHKGEGLEDQNTVNKTIHDGIYVGRTGTMFLSYVHLAENKECIGSYVTKGDLETAISTNTLK